MSSLKNFRMIRQLADHDENSREFSTFVFPLPNTFRSCRNGIFYPKQGYPKLKRSNTKQAVQGPKRAPDAILLTKPLPKKRQQQAKARVPALAASNNASAIFRDA